MDAITIILEDEGSDTARIRELSPEDAANPASALSHPARIVILREMMKSSQYPSDLEKKVSAKYGALYHHLNTLMEADLVEQEKERGKYVATAAGKACLLFLNVLASIIRTLKSPSSTSDLLSVRLRLSRSKNVT